MKRSVSMVLWGVALLLFALLCYSFVIWSNCGSGAGSFLGDVRAFHGEGC